MCVYIDVLKSRLVIGHVNISSQTTGVHPDSPRHQHHCTHTHRQILTKICTTGHLCSTSWCFLLLPVLADIPYRAFPQLTHSLTSSCIHTHTHTRTHTHMHTRMHLHNRSVAQHVVHHRPAWRLLLTRLCGWHAAAPCQLKHELQVLEGHAGHLPLLRRVPGVCV